MDSAAHPTPTVAAAPARELDPVTFAVIRHAFENVVNEMGAKIVRAAYSPVVNEGRDFGASIVTADGRLVAQGDQDLPAFIGIAPIWAKTQIDWIGIENFAAGDVVIANDPYMGGTHCMDVRFMMPVFYEGELVAFVQDIAHWVDCGGPLPGGFNPRASHIFQESLRITPLHVVRRGELERDVVRFILANVRLPDWSFGDLMGQIQALRVGEARLIELFERYGALTVLAAMDEVISASESLMRRQFAEMPNGEYHAVDFIDRDPASDSDDPLTIDLTIRIAGDRLECDLSGSSPQAKGPVNCSRGVAISALMVAIKSMFPGIPMNEGVSNAIDFVVPDGLVCSCVFPAPVSGMASACYARVLDCVYHCFTEILPDAAMGCPYTILNIIVGGEDDRPHAQRRPFVMYTWLEGGYGGRVAKRDNHSAMSLFASGTQSIPIETLEREYPVVFDEYAYATDSEGAGRHRGGFGVRKTLRMTCEGARITCQGDRERHTPWGFDGGLPAGGNQLWYALGTDDETSIGVFAADFPLAKNVPVTIVSNGGGGWGPPRERPVEWVLEEVTDGLISIERAREVYGVAVEPTGDVTVPFRVNAEATRLLREV